jgi:hypothetical protein
MTSTAATPESETTSSDSPHLIREFTFPLPGWVRGLPGWVRVSSILLILILASLWVRTHYIGGQFWIDEGLTVGISSHSLGSIPGILRMDGSPPLFYMLLHIWMQMVGNGEAATHWLSEIFATLTIPVGYWAGKTIAGTKRAALMSATLFAFNAFLDYYSQETRMYALMGLLGLLATVGFINGFVHRRRPYVALFSISMALMFYTHAWAIYFCAGSFLSVLLLWYISEDDIRDGLIKDVLLAYIGAVILFVPWIPNFIFQAIHTAAPWDNKPRFGAPVQIAQGVLGGASITTVLLIAAGIGYSGLFGRRGRSTVQAKVALMLFTLMFVTLLMAWLGSQVTPAWVVRYFAPVVAPIVLLLAIGVSRAGVIGAIAILFSICFMMRPSAFLAQHKSDVQDLSAQMWPLMHPGDEVVVGQPEQTALAYYYFGAGLKWANTIGPVKDPSYLDWVDALKRYKAVDESKMLAPIVNNLKDGQEILFIRPLTEGTANWSAAWTYEVLVQSAKAGWFLDHDNQLREVAVAPANYRPACCIADAAILYKKVS